MTTRSLSYTHSGETHPAAQAGLRSVAPAGLPTSEEILSRASGENFRVASRLLPRDSRKHLLAWYGFARLVDEIGDSYSADRLAALDWIEAETAAALADPHEPGLHPLVAKAGASVRATGADGRDLSDLIAANRQDQVVHRYSSFAELVAYCRLSANPVGHLVLAAFSAATPDRIRWADAICTALQLAEHWQDVAEDAAAGRVYVPADDMDRFGVDLDDLSAPQPASSSLRALMAFEVARARRLLDEGAPLMSSLDGRARWAVAGFWTGGHCALDALAHNRFDPLGGAARTSRARLAVRTVAGLRSLHPESEAA